MIRQLSQQSFSLFYLSLTPLPPQGLDLATVIARDPTHRHSACISKHLSNHDRKCMLLQDIHKIEDKDRFSGRESTSLYPTALRTTYSLWLPHQQAAHTYTCDGIFSRASSADSDVASKRHQHPSPTVRRKNRDAPRENNIPGLCAHTVSKRHINRPSSQSSGTLVGAKQGRLGSPHLFQRIRLLSTRGTTEAPGSVAK